MDKSILKKFAIESRQDLMEKIKNKINTFYVDEDFINEQKGDLYILSNEKHSLSLTNDEYKKRELLIKRIKELSLEQVIEEAAYTWFNRIIAIRYMEINDMLPLTKDNQSLGMRVLSSRDNTPDPEILKFTNLVNPDLDIDFKKEKYAELKDDNEKFKYVLLLVCKKLGRVIPQVFDGITDYIDILIPDSLLNDTGFITKVINEVPENNYNQVEIIGWLYQYYNNDIFNSIFDKDMVKKRLNYSQLPAATQLFTPDWVVKYLIQNSLGKILRKICNFKFNMEYFLDNDDNYNNIKKITDIKLYDPCCGSGHMLVYAFELFYEAYKILGFKSSEIPSLILKNNLFGTDIDDRAAQLSVLSILLKAREYDKNFFAKIESKEVNIVSINSSSNISDDMITFLKQESNIILAKELKKQFIDAKELGSLLKVPTQDYSNLLEELKADETIFGIELREKMIPLIKQANILSSKYDVVVTNPPYLNSSRMSIKLSNYIQKNYPDSKSDMATSFIEVINDKYTEKDGYSAFITTISWMFLSSFEKFRNKMLLNYKFDSLVDYGTELFDGKIGHLPVVAWVNKNCSPMNESLAIKLSSFIYNRREEKKIEFFNKKNYYTFKQKDFLKIPGSPFAYWVSDNFINNFNECKYIEDYGILTGSQNITGDNNKYLRNWWEINSNEINNKWFFYSKGGDYKKYYGNLNLLIDWSESARKFYKENTTSNLLNEELWYKEGITYSAITSIGPSFRYFPKNCLFDKGGPVIIMNNNIYSILGLLNSKVAKYYLNVFNSTVNIQTRDIKAFPIKMPNDNIEDLVKEQVNIAKEFWDSMETSIDYRGSLIISGLNTIKESICASDKKLDELVRKYKNNEEKINQIVIKTYNLENEINSRIKDSDIPYIRITELDYIKALISYAVGCMFGRYSLDKDGFIYAGGDFDSVYQKFKKKDGGWAGASLSNYKILNDNGNEVELSFEVDNDNVIPITDEAYFGDDIVERFKNFIKVAYGEHTFNENMDFIAEALGKKGTETSEETIRRYFVNDFFNDHIKMYQKRPIYWLLDSGKKNGFKALVYMHRYNENLIPKARLDYLHRVQTTYEKLLSDVNYRLTTELSMTDKKEAKNRQTDLMAKLQEIKEYDEKIAHIANQRISVDLDDGVKANYDKFKDILAKIK